jgi:Flp pilus assembly protein TadD
MRYVERTLVRLAWIAAVMTLAACSTLPGLTTQTASEPAAVIAKPAQATAAPAKQAVAPTAKPVAEPAPVSPAVQRAYDAARQALAAGRNAEAERGFSALTKSNPELAGPYANLGLMHRQAGRNAEAIAALEKAAQLSPQRADLHNQLGIAYRMAGDFAKAKSAYEKSIALDAAYAPAVLNLGILYDLYLWDGARALELYDRYLQLAPGGDDQVKRWIGDLRNRNPQQKSVAQRKEQG